MYLANTEENGNNDCCNSWVLIPGVVVTPFKFKSVEIHCVQHANLLPTLHHKGWLRDPEPNPRDTNRYLTSIGKSLKESLERNDRKGSQYVGNRVWQLILCGECLKQTFVYSQYLLSQPQRLALEWGKESVDLICASLPSYEFYNTVFSYWSSLLCLW